MHFRRILLTVLMAGIALPGAALGQEDVHPLLTSKVWLSLGAYFPRHSLDIQANLTPASPGFGVDPGFNVPIDIEKDWGVSDSEDLLMAELGWQFGDKWGIGLQYFQSERSNSLALDDTIEWEDVTYEVGAQVSAGTEMAITRVFFQRRFLERGNHDLRLGLGFHWFDFKAQIAGQATLADMSTEFRSERVSASAPVPNIGVWYRYSPNQRWAFTGRADWLSASVNDISGRILNLSAGVNVSLFNHFGIGVNYQFFELDVSVRETSWRGNLVAQFDGPYVYLSAYF